MKNTLAIVPCFVILSIASLTGVPRIGVAQTGLQISAVSDNRAQYAGGSIPRYEKFEITFQISNSVAKSMQLPYDSAPPAGLQSGIGITVDATLTPDNWQTVYTQPAFYYQEFDYGVRSNQDWMYPNGRFSWKVRFAPNREGAWKYRLSARDAGSATQSPEYSFTVSSSTNHGFVRVSKADARYFEFEDGRYFPGLGFNMNYDHLSWTNPVVENTSNFQVLGNNGIQLIRIWLSQWAIFGSEWNPWNSQDPWEHGAYLPDTAITFEDAYPGSEVSMHISATNDRDRCMFIGIWKGKPAVKRNTSYRVRIRYKTRNMGTPTDSTKPWGFAAKTGDWLWSDTDSERCYSAGVGTVVTPHQNQNTSGWQILEGAIQTGETDFLPNFFLVMDNTTQGDAYVDYVWIEENLGSGQYGPNIVSKPWMAHHFYFEQRNSYAFDKVLELAKSNNIYLRPVVLEKNDRLFDSIGYDGAYTSSPSNDNFYGNWDQMTKVRWLQRAWWRYLQARWGYSTNIHSWELLNEGDPYSGLHWWLAEEFGMYMHQFMPDSHLVSTSNWHSFPKSQFWANPDYKDVDFADVHLYVPRQTDINLRIDDTSQEVLTAAQYFDTAAATGNLSALVGARQSYGALKPVIRGETGFTQTDSQAADPQILADKQGVWLHNFVWGGIHSGGLIESYWYDRDHISGRNGDGIDLRPVFKPYYDFIKDLPLNNGAYRDAAATCSDARLRAWGQRDATAGRAHLWIQNSLNTWKAKVDGAAVPALTGTVAVPGLPPSTSFRVEWWNTYQGIAGSVQTLSTNNSGTLTLNVSNLTTDTAVRITPADSIAAPKNLRIVN
jgi:hypothetical protein